MDMSKLRPDTGRLWRQLQDHPDLRGFILVGGTALTLRIGHRVSEDLNFAYPAVRLPRPQLRSLVRSVSAKGIHMVPNQDPLAVEDALNAGQELEDYQQDYIAEGTVKVTFFAPEADMVKVLGGTPGTSLRVASMDEIFASKALVCADRSKTRDWFDLFTMMTHHGYGMEDFYRVFEDLDCLPKFSIAETRLRSGRPAVGDEGYESLLDNPPDVKTMCTFFSDQLDQFQTQLAKKRFEQQASGADKAEPPPKVKPQ